MTDAFDALRADLAPVAPSTSFARDLRARLITELEHSMSTTAPATTAPTAPTVAVANTVTPYLCVNGAAAAIDFYVAVFGAVEHHRMVGDDGRIGHAEILIGNSRLMLADEYPEVGVLSPTTRGGTSTNFTIDVSDVDSTFQRAIELGGTEVRPVADQFHGNRQGTFRDPFGHQWSISSPIVGFGDDDYDANSIRAGFEVQRPADSVATSAVMTATARSEHDSQFKHHVLGDLYYFTLHTPDLARAQRFYDSVLGWQFPDSRNGHVGNITAPPGGLDDSGEAGNHRAQLYFVVENIDAAVDRVRAAGGSAQTPVHYDSGWSADCTDDQGTAFSLSVPIPEYGGLDLPVDHEAG